MNSAEVKAGIEKHGAPWFFENYLKIVPKETHENIPFKLNNVQRDIVWPEFQRQLRMDGMIRLYVLKARRMGLSTFTAAYIYMNTIYHKNTTSYIIAHDLNAAKTVFNMYETFYGESPPWLQPATRRANARELLFARPDRAAGGGLNSHIKVMVAADRLADLKKGGLGRSDNIRHVHGSEVAFWTGAEQIQHSLQQSVPRAPGTSIVYESTGIEAGGAFYEGYQRAKRGEGRFVALFIPWFKFDKYRMPLEPGEMLDLDFTERWLYDHLHCPMEALKWRRQTLSDECNGKLEIFQREYPSTDEEAFLMSQGKNVFNVNMLQSILESADATKPVARYSVARGNLKENGSGAFKVWREPSAGHQYIVGCDPAEGLDTGCYQAIEVLDCATLEEVAAWAGMVPINELARILCAIGQKYRNAVLAPERNNHGLAVVNALHELGYSNIYRMRDFGRVQHGSAPQYGWMTTGVTKPLLEAFFDSMLNDGQLILNNPELVREAINYVYDPTGTGGKKTGPPSGKFSDRLIAYMIAAFLSNERFPRGRIDRKLMRQARKAQALELAPPGERPAKSLQLAIEESERNFRDEQASRFKPTHGTAKLVYRGR